MLIGPTAYTAFDPSRTDRPFLIGKSNWLFGVVIADGSSWEEALDLTHKFLGITPPKEK